jgi:nicotinamidase-related amidase
VTPPGASVGKPRPAAGKELEMELLDVTRSVVLVIDLQGKLMEMVERPKLLVDASVRLLSVADIFGVPVALTEQYPSGIGPTHPEVRAAFDSLSVPKGSLSKTAFGCCGDPGFIPLLESLKPGIQVSELQVVVAGIEAHVCVMQTVLELLRLGTQVHLCWECVSGRGAEYRERAIERMCRAGAAVTNHESVGFEWARHKDHASFKAFSRLLKSGQLNP